MNLTFGHKDLPQHKSSTLSNLINDKQFNLTEADLSEPAIQTAISETLDKSKESAQSYLEFALDCYKKHTKENYRTCIHNAGLAINRRYDELLSDVLDISHKFGKDGDLERVKKFEFITKSLGIFIPTLIKQYVVDPRNDLEHEFKASTKDESLKSYEIARLFVDYTSKYLEGGLIKSIEVGYMENPFQLGTGFVIRFGENTSKETKKRFLVTYKENAADTGNYFLMDSAHDEYLNLLLELCSTKELNKEAIKDILSKI